MFYVEVCIPHGDLGIFTTLCSLQQFSLFISLQHRMTCTNSHCNFNLTCVCIYFRFGSAISLSRSQTDGNMYIVAENVYYFQYTHTCFLLRLSGATGDILFHRNSPSMTCSWITILTTTTTDCDTKWMPPNLSL